MISTLMITQTEAYLYFRIYKSLVWLTEDWYVSCIIEINMHIVH